MAEFWRLSCKFQQLEHIWQVLKIRCFTIDMKEHTHKVIIIGIDHHNTLGVIRSLGECGVKSYLILEDQPKTSFVNKSKYLEKCILLVNNSIVDTLLYNFKGEIYKPVIICTTDSSIDAIDLHYDQLKEFFVCPNAGSQGGIHQLLNKEYTIKIAERCGIRIPMSISLSKDDDIPQNLMYPCYIKAIDSICGSKADSCLCYNDKEIKSALSKKIGYQVQEYIEKDTELLINGVALEHGNKSYFPLVIEKIRQYPSNVGACTYCKVDSIDNYQYIDVLSIKKFIKEIRYEGVFSIEFLVKGGKTYFLEINLRNDGTAYIPTIADFKMHYMWYCYTAKTYTSTPQIKREILPFYFSSDVTDIKHVFEKRISICKWFRDTMKARAYLLFNKHDIKPWLHFYLNILKRKI